ncbi:transglycosylase SLT domain-containing protein [Rehaibacterium terrae]|uniref:transglycosylase SLT domain-containing protein n=2 Tax=Rehaibacterium terrae TaxID=1341696 RepID=UPI00391A5F31
MRNPLIPLLLSLLSLLWLAPAGAADEAALAARRDELRHALQIAERGSPAQYEAVAKRLADHPLFPWLEYARLRRDLGTATPGRVEGFLRRFDGQPAAQLLREAWLGELIRRQDWPRFLATYRPDSDPTRRCAHAQARLAAGAVDEGWLKDVEALWLNGRSMPDLCDAPFAELQRRGRLTPELRWQRIELAAEAGELGIMRFLARGLPAAEAALAQDYAAFVESPHERAARWPADARSRRIAMHGLVRAARRDPDGVEARLAALTPVLGLGEAERGPVLYQIALWTVASYGEASARRLAAVPASAWDARLHEWQVREALARQDDAAALAALERMPEAQRRDARWRYFEARLRERRGERDLAHALYAEAARDASFHGFLAADRLNQPYALCPKTPRTPAEIAAEVASHPGLVRAFELRRIDRPGWAEREWRAAVAGFDATRRIEAVRLARRQFWHDRAVFFLGREDPDELRYYRLRFPLSYPRTVRAEAERHGLGPAVVAAEIRAESAWMREARSHADARGLMQVLPATGAAVARRHGIAWGGPDTLYRPVTNIRIGTAYLREMIDRHDGKYFLAMAAYNAGPAPVQRWLAQRPDLDPDFWIETIPFKETRDYVARVLAFSVIYDWRLGQESPPVSERMLGRDPPPDRRRAHVCPSPTESIAP